MSRVSRSQGLKRFCELTGASDNAAYPYLHHANYNVDHALTMYLSEVYGVTDVPLLTPQQEKAARKELGALFDKYRDADDDTISSEGALRMLSDLDIDPASVDVLPLSYYLDSPGLGQFTRAGYVHGWIRLNVCVTSTEHVLSLIHI